MTSTRINTICRAFRQAALIGGFTAAAFHVNAQASGATTPTAAAAATTAKATFAGGCFWCVESDFDKVPGVLSTTSGYIGGTTANPTYEQVSSKRTGHAEAVQIEFDPKVVSYDKLLDVYWHSIDPTTKDASFCDHGTPYRTAIFTHDEVQAEAAKRSLVQIEKTKPFKEPIVTQIQPATAFYAAEDYHQDYYKKNPLRYRYYRASCGRDARVEQLWGSQAVSKAH